jgi:hypothetical protein
METKGSLEGVRVTQSVQWLTTDWQTGVWSLAGAKDFYSSLCVQTLSGEHPASHSMGTRGPYSGSEMWTRCEVDHSPSSSAKVKNQ